VSNSVQGIGLGASAQSCDGREASADSATGRLRGRRGPVAAPSDLYWGSSLCGCWNRKLPDGAIAIGVVTLSGAIWLLPDSLRFLLCREKRSRGSTGVSATGAAAGAPGAEQAPRSYSRSSEIRRSGARSAAGVVEAMGLCN